MPTKEWLDETVEISRDELAHILAKEARRVIDLADKVGCGKELRDHIKELLLMYSSSVATIVFSKNDKEDEKYG